MKRAIVIAPLALLLALPACSSRYRAPMPLPSQPLVATGADAIPEPPAPGVAPEPTIEPFETSRLSNGLTIIIAPRPYAPNVNVVYTSRAAASRDERAYRGLTEITNAAMLRATLLEDGSAQPNYFSANQYGGVSLATSVDGTTLTERLTSASHIPGYLPLLSNVLRRPAFREQDIEALLRDRRDRAHSRRGSASTIRAHWLRRAIYARDDRRSRDPGGGNSAIERTTARLVRTRHAQAYTPSQSAIIVVGPIDPSVVRRAIEDSFGDWRTEHDEPARISDPVYAPDEGARALGLVAGTRQTHIHLWERAPAWGHEDYPAFEVLTTVLGGMFLSRMNMEIRERRGASYGVNARLLSSSTDTELEISTAVQPELTGHVVGLIVQELERMCGERGGVAQDELEMARAVAREGYLARIETSAGLAAALAQAFRADLPPTHLTDVVAHIDALTLEDLHSTAQRWIRPQRAPMVVIGQWMQIHGALQQAGIGAIETRDLPRYRRD